LKHRILSHRTVGSGRFLSISLLHLLARPFIDLQSSLRARSDSTIFLSLDSDVPRCKFRHSSAIVFFACQSFSSSCEAKSRSALGTSNVAVLSSSAKRTLDRCSSRAYLMPVLFFTLYLLSSMFIDLSVMELRSLVVGSGNCKQRVTIFMEEEILSRSLLAWFS